MLSNALIIMGAGRGSHPRDFKGVRYLKISAVEMARFSKLVLFVGLLLIAHAAYSAVQREYMIV